MKKILILAIGILTAVACSEKSDPTLTPVRNVVGTWKTAIPVEFYYKTDFCGWSIETVAKAKWAVTWIITPRLGTENQVSIEMRYTSSDYQRMSSSCGATGSTGYIPQVSPMFFTATINGNLLDIDSETLGISFDGSFTTDLMQGTWDAFAYGSGEFTETNALKLIKQK